MKINYSERFIEKILVFLGLINAMYQWLFNRDLWLDEAYVALNLLHKTLPQMLQPLEYRQMATPIFLLFEKTMFMLMPNTELSLRVYALMSFFGVVWLFYRVMGLLFKHTSTQGFLRSQFWFLHP